MVFGFLRKKDQKPISPIREQVDPRAKLHETSIKLRIMIEKLERNEARLEYRNKQLFDKVVRAEAAKQKERASAYAREMVQIRNIAKTSWMGITALEKLALRLDTVRSAMDAKEILSSPELGLLRPLSESLKQVMPEVSLELSKMNENMEEIAMSFGTIDEYPAMAEEHDDEVKQILREASEVASQRMKSAFPDLPGVERESESTRWP